MKQFIIILIGFFMFSTVNSVLAATMKYATVAPDKTPWVGEMKVQKERIETMTKSHIKVKLFTSGALGDEVKLISSLRRGRVHAAYVSSVPIGNIIPEFELVSFPFIWDSVEERDYVFDNYLFDAYTPLFEKAGLKLLAWSETGSFIIGSKEKVVMPDDNKGKRYRSVQQDFMIGYVNTIGAKPIDIPIMETATSMQTGLVDGVSTTLVALYFFDIYKNVNYVTLTESCYAPSMHVVSKRWFDRLSKENQSAVMKNSRDATKRSRMIIRKTTAALMDRVKKSGVEVVQLSTDQRAVWKKSVELIVQEHLNKRGKKAKEIYALIQRGKVEFRERKR